MQLPAQQPCKACQASSTALVLEGMAICGNQALCKPEYRRALGGSEVMPGWGGTDC